MHTSYYEHSGQHLTSEIAAEFIYKTYCGTEVSESHISKELLAHHKAGGGLAPTANILNDFDPDAVYDVVSRGVRILEKNGCASRRPPQISIDSATDGIERIWCIHDRESSEYPKTIGEGAESVYLYYCPAYKQLAESRVAVWKRSENVYYECNIGLSVRTTTTRVNEKIKNLPEKPILALTMKTDKSKVLEDIIHNILRYHDRQCDTHRTDWFYTNPKEVENIFNAVESMYF